MRHACTKFSWNLCKDSANDMRKERKNTLNGAWNYAFPFWLYGSLAIIAAFIVLRFVPETRGVDSEHLTALWKREDLGTAAN